MFRYVLALMLVSGCVKPVETDVPKPVPVQEYTLEDAGAKFSNDYVGGLADAAGRMATRLKSGEFTSYLDASQAWIAETKDVREKVAGKLGDDMTSFGMIDGDEFDGNSAATKFESLQSGFRKSLR